MFQLLQTRSVVPFPWTCLLDTTLGSDPHAAGALPLPRPRVGLLLGLGIAGVVLLTAAAVAVTIWISVPPSLLVTADVPGAMVYLDNRLVGLAPVSIAGGTPVSAQIRVEAPGYAPWGDMATVPERGVTHYRAVLAPLPGP